MLAMAAQSYTMHIELPASSSSLSLFGLVHRNKGGTLFSITSYIEIREEQNGEKLTCDALAA
jgi:hypothetical protein